MKRFSVTEYPNSNPKTPFSLQTVQLFGLVMKHQCLMAMRF